VWPMEAKDQRRKGLLLRRPDLFNEPLAIYKYYKESPDDKKPDLILYMAKKEKKEKPEKRESDDEFPILRYVRQRL